jgi:uncharacterized protein DUF2510
LSSADPPPSAPAGWYVNPSGSGQRYWDGEYWTDSYSGAGPPSPAEERRGEDGVGNMGLVVAGYSLAVFLPLFGFIIGIVVATRPQKRISKHGVWIVVVSIVVTALYLVVVLHSGRSPESTSLRL